MELVLTRTSSTRSGLVKAAEYALQRVTAGEREIRYFLIGKDSAHGRRRSRDQRIGFRRHFHGLRARGGLQREIQAYLLAFAQRHIVEGLGPESHKRRTDRVGARLETRECIRAGIVGRALRHDAGIHVTRRDIDFWNHCARGVGNRPTDAGIHLSGCGNHKAQQQHGRAGMKPEVS
jgi:hypothetical protein